MMRRLLPLLLLAFCASAFSQDKALQQSLTSYFNNYSNPAFSSRERFRVEDIVFRGDTVELQLNEPFLGQPFTEATVKRIYGEVRACMPEAYRERPLLITVCGHTLDELIPAFLLPHNRQRSWGDLDYRGQSWVRNLDRPVTPKEGLDGRHLALWASHGYYYKNDKREWVYQRPRLHTTCEDLFTSTIVYPFLIPMLERAGAVVFSPRETSWQKHEVLDGNIFEEGDYPVYVRYTQADKSMTVCVVHEGIETRLAVNRRMGFGIWCYLGTWHFQAGYPKNNRVFSDDNRDLEVRLGGGMGSISRGGMRSGKGRAWEGSRYWAEYNRLPSPIWMTKDGANDYAEDINTRSLAVNHVARGSVFLPKDSIDCCRVDSLTGDTVETWREERDGLHVPLELSLAVHSDAGQTEGGYIGSLAVYTTAFMDGRYPTGLSRLAGRDLADEMMTTFTSDMRRTYGSWNRRQLYERNYSESREPRIPCMIFETLSHQNYEDMKIGLDPVGRFTMARAVYKTLLRYTRRMHGLDAGVVAPLPVRNLMAVVDEGRIFLRWEGEEDPLEPSARPDGYILYMKKGTGGWDNGTYMRGNVNACNITAPEGMLCQFRVTAVNAGGESLDSPTVCAMIGRKYSARVLLVDGFSRVAAPEPFGGKFYPEADPGVPYVSEPRPSGLLQAGNTRDWSVRYAEDLLQNNYTFSSATEGALPWLSLPQHDAVCLIYGAQRNDGYSHRAYPVLPTTTVSLLSRYTQQGGNLMMTGAYVAESLSPEAQQFARRMLGWEQAMSIATDTCSVHGMSLEFRLPDKSESEQHYCVARVSALQVPVGTPENRTPDKIFPTMLYRESSLPAAIAAEENGRRSITFGFPLELIPDDGMRRSVVNASLKYLLP